MHKWFAVEPHLIIANSSTVYPEWRVCMFVRLSVCRKNVRNTNENGDSHALFLIGCSKTMSMFQIDARAETRLESFLQVLCSVAIPL